VLDLWRIVRGGIVIWTTLSLRSTRNGMGFGTFDSQHRVCSRGRKFPGRVSKLSGLRRDSPGSM